MAPRRNMIYGKLWGMYIKSGKKEKIISRVQNSPNQLDRALYFQLFLIISKIWAPILALTIHWPWENLTLWIQFSPLQQLLLKPTLQGYKENLIRWWAWKLFVNQSAIWLLLWTEWCIEGFWKRKWCHGRLGPSRMNFVRKVGLEVLGGISNGKQGTTSRCNGLSKGKEVVMRMAH